VEVQLGHDVGEGPVAVRCGQESDDGREDDDPNERDDGMHLAFGLWERPGLGGLCSAELFTGPFEALRDRLADAFGDVEAVVVGAFGFLPVFVEDECAVLGGDGEVVFELGGADEVAERADGGADGLIPFVEGDGLDFEGELGALGFGAAVPGAIDGEGSLLGLELLDEVLVEEDAILWREGGLEIGSDELDADGVLLELGGGAGDGCGGRGGVSGGGTIQSGDRCGGVFGAEDEDGAVVLAGGVEELDGEEADFFVGDGAEGEAAAVGDDHAGDAAGGASGLDALVAAGDGEDALAGDEDFDLAECEPQVVCVQGERACGVGCDLGQADEELGGDGSGDCCRLGGDLLRVHEGRGGQEQDEGGRLEDGADGAG